MNRKRIAQNLFINLLITEDVSHFLPNVYISPNATINPKDLIIGEKIAIGSESQVGIDLELVRDAL